MATFLIMVWNIMPSCFGDNCTDLAKTGKISNKSRVLYEEIKSGPTAALAMEEEVLE